MPVPVSVTHPKGAGIKAASAAVLPSEGPFERLKRQAEAAAAAAGGGAAAAPAAPADAASAAATTTATVANPSAPATTPQAIEVDNLEFSYPGLDGRPVPGLPPLISGMRLALPPGSRTLLLGANGAGKTTLLRILAGKHMVSRDSVRVLGQPPFHDTSLTTSGELAYVGGSWARDVAFAGAAVPLTGDFPARRLLDGIPGAIPSRRDALIKALDIDPEWRMHRVSDGQRRRVQVAAGLMRPFKVLLLDEVTVDLDVLGRASLMDFLREECASRGCCVVYATHIFDGLEGWPTHVAYVARGALEFAKPAAEVAALKEGCLLEMVAGLLREDREEQAKRRRVAMEAMTPEQLKQQLHQGAVRENAQELADDGLPVIEYDASRDGEVGGAFSYVFNNGWVPGTLNTSLKLSSNAVVRN
jgi:CCR4-NOT complex subunit CAF16